MNVGEAAVFNWFNGIVKLVFRRLKGRERY